jgi:hypothetical protein
VAAVGDPIDTGTKPVKTDTDEYVLRSYRYLRLAIVVLLVGLAAALIGQQWSAGCIEGSISAYYYTPVHGLFIGSLVGTGAAMVALRGRTTVEDTFFNVAGLLAPVVALVPTTRQDVLCDGKALPLNLDRDDLVPNSLFALLAAGATILVVTAIIAKSRKSLGDQAESLKQSLLTGVAPSALLIVAGLVTVFVFDQPLYTFMHFGAAVGLFAAIFLAIGSLLSKRFHGVLHRVLTFGRPKEPYRKPEMKYYRRYTGVLIATVPSVIVAALVGRSWIFWVEVVGIASFTLFWIIQTAELWDRLPDPAPIPEAAAA